MSGHVEFAIGIIEDGDDFVMSFGFQDNAAYLLRFPQSIVEEILDVDLTQLLEKFIFAPEDPEINLRLVYYDELTDCFYFLII